MTYNITRLMDDARLRRGLLELDVTAEDLTGEFGCLDFSQSLLKNHRAVFDRLSELGGEELLGKLMRSNPPCLTDDPKSAKQGVRPIKGTEKYFLKTNAGGPTVLASILGAIAFWMEDQGRDPDEAILFHTDEEAVEEDEEDEDDEEDEEDDADWESEEISDSEPDKDGLFEVLPPRPCSLIQKNGKYALFYEDDKSFLSVDYEYVSGETVSATEFAQCRLIDGERPELGWQYKLTEDEDDPWGWISACGNHYLSPRFNMFFPAEVELDLEFNGERNLRTIFRGCSIRRTEYCCFDTFCAVDSSCRDFYFLCPGDDSAPWRMERVDDLSYPSLSDLKNSRVVIYTPGNDFLCKVNGKFGCCVIDSEWYAWKHEDEILILENRHEKYRWPIRDISYDGFCTTLEKGKQCKEGLVPLCSWDEMPYYALRRDGWWAVAEVYYSGVQLLTPFAFTEAPQRLRGGDRDLFILVSRFGKKGVFSCKSGTYPVPCDYEEVETGFLWEEDSFRVRRMGYEGRIDQFGKWVEHLHREED